MARQCKNWKLMIYIHIHQNTFTNRFETERESKLEMEERSSARIRDTFLNSTNKKRKPTYILCNQYHINVERKKVFAFSLIFTYSCFVDIEKPWKAVAVFDPQFISKERAIYDQHPGKKINTWGIEKYIHQFALFLFLDGFSCWIGDRSMPPQLITFIYCQYSSTQPVQNSYTNSNR